MRRNRASPLKQQTPQTTIVGARPPGSAKGPEDIPRGIEVLVKKASVDPQFKELLLKTRAQAAKVIELELEAAEALMLSSVPRTQLEAIIANTKVNPTTRRAFLGTAAAVMLAALGAVTGGCGKREEPATEGIRPDRPETRKRASEPRVEEDASGMTRS